MRPNLSSHYTNDRHDLWEFPRRSIPQWHPPAEGYFGPDFWVVLASACALVVALWVAL
jgi:hypothetical protein